MPRWIVDVSVREPVDGERWEHGIEVDADTSVEAVAAAVVDVGPEWIVSDNAPVLMHKDR